MSLTSQGCLVRLIYNASRGCIVPSCARRDVEACGRISLEGDENGIGGWRKQRQKKRKRRGSKKDRRPGETKREGRGRRERKRERGKSFHRDRNERGSGRCSIVFSPSDPERPSLRRKRAGSQTHFYDFNIADICAEQRICELLTHSFAANMTSLFLSHGQSSISMLNYFSMIYN